LVIEGKLSPDKAFVYRLAAVVSIIGHPLLTAALFTLFVTCYLFDGEQAVASSVIVTGLVILPVAWWNYHNTKKGSYSNFDVSVRTQRHSFYGVLTGLAGLATLTLWLTGQPAALLCGMGAALLLLVLSGLVNLYLKASLHTSFSVFFSFTLMNVHCGAGAILLAFSAAIAVSRVILKRHTPAEVGAGAIIGSVAGGSLYFAIQYITG
jgi:membrane-associated phospholipid phosphatase